MSTLLQKKSKQKSLSSSLILWHKTKKVEKRKLSSLTWIKCLCLNMPLTVTVFIPPVTGRVCPLLTACWSARLYSYLGWLFKVARRAKLLNFCFNISVIFRKVSLTKFLNITPIYNRYQLKLLPAKTMFHVSWHPLASPVVQTDWQSKQRCPVQSNSMQYM